MKALFIVFEGLDGSGTSTQAELLQQYFTSCHQQAIISPEPTDGPIGKFIRSILNHQVDLNQTDHRFDQQMSYLFAADRHYHLYHSQTGLMSLLDQGITVISTRYYFSSFAYHCHQPQDWELVKRLNRQFPAPDLVVYLDIPLKITLERIQTRSTQEIYENEQKLTQVKTNYEQLFATYPGLQLKLDATQGKKTIHNQIVDFIRKQIFVDGKGT